MTQATVSSTLFGTGRDAAKRGDEDDIVALLGEGAETRYREVCELSRHDHDEIVRTLVNTTRLCRGTHLWSRGDVDFSLNDYADKLASQMRSTPREDGESLKAYVARLRNFSEGFANIFRRIADIQLLEAHYDAEDRAEAKRARVAAEAEERHRNAELVRQSEPDRDEVRQLLETIESARAGERFIAQLSEALHAHRKAEQARGKLSVIFRDERSACNSLGKRAPSRPEVPQAPQGAREIARRMAAG